jgi:hypothetical protein
MKDFNKRVPNLNLINLKPTGVRIKCDRCKGTGNIPRFNHVEHGICFKCRGTKEFIRY